MFKVYVGNLDSRVTADVLRPLFEPFGDLDEIIVATDSKTNRSRGFAIVLFRDALKGQLAIETLTGRKLSGRTIVINEAVKRGKAPSSGAPVPARKGPFGPRFGGAAQGGASGGRRFSHRNPRRGLSGGPGGGPPGPGPVRPGGAGGSIHGGPASGGAAPGSVRPEGDASHGFGGSTPRSAGPQAPGTSQGSDRGGRGTGITPRHPSEDQGPSRPAAN